MAGVKKTNPIDDFFNFVGKNASNVINNFKPGINNPTTIKKEPFNLSSLVSREVTNPVTNMIKSLPYNNRTSARNNPPAGALSLDMNKVQKQYDTDYATYKKASPVGKLGINNILGESWQPVKSESAVMNPYVRDITPSPKSNPYLEGIKRKVLSNPNLTSQAKEYLSKIPISFEKYQPNEEGKIPLGVSYGTRRGANGADIAKNPYITISDKFANPPSTYGEDPMNPEQEAVWKQEMMKEQEKNLEIVIKHELTHQTPRLVPVELFKPQNKVIIDQYVNRWGEKYMKNPGYLVEEMFAERDLPPAYYYHVFKSINPNASKQDFVGYLKSFFINKVNTPAPSTGGGGSF